MDGELRGHRFGVFCKLSNVKGGNSYGVPFKKWAAMSAKEKVAFRKRIWRQRRMENDPEGFAAHLKAQHEARRGTPELRAAYNARRNEWRKANRELKNRHNRDYRARMKVKGAIALNPDAIYRDIMKAIPRGWQKSLRDDIAGMVCLDILEGKAQLGDMDRLVKDAYKRLNKLMDTWSTLSLDAPIPGHDKGTYIDRLVDPTTVEA